MHDDPLYHLREKLVYPREKTLRTLTLVLGLVGWVLIIVLTFGTVFIYLLLGFIGYLFAQSGLIAWLRSTGVRLSRNQLPDLYAEYLVCCARLGMRRPPRAYLLQGNGLMNAFAARFMGRNYVIVLADTVDAVKDLPDGVKFYFGHELGHIKQGHLTGRIWRAPALWLPLIGAAYARAKEYTCDRHGRACCAHPEAAARALCVLAVGAEKYRQINLPVYVGQIRRNRGFFTDFHELLSGHPWLTKRVARMMYPTRAMPERSWFSYLLAFFIPYGGRAGGGALGLAILFVIIIFIGVAAAELIPVYRDNTVDAQLIQRWNSAAPVRAALSAYYTRHKDVPRQLSDAGISPGQARGLGYDTNGMRLNARTPYGVFTMTPWDNDGRVEWHCEGTGEVKKHLPAFCKGPDNDDQDKGKDDDKDVE